MMTPDFALNQVCELRAWQGREVSREMYGEPVRLRCRVSLARQLAQEAGAVPREGAVASGKVYFPAGTRVAPRDRVTFEGQDYVVLSSRVRRGLRGEANHVEATVR